MNLNNLSIHNLNLCFIYSHLKYDIFSVTILKLSSFLQVIYATENFVWKVSDPAFSFHCLETEFLPPSSEAGNSHSLSIMSVR